MELCLPRAKAARNSGYLELWLFWSQATRMLGYLNVRLPGCQVTWNSVFSPCLESFHIELEAWSISSLNLAKSKKRNKIDKKNRGRKNIRVLNLGLIHKKLKELKSISRSNKLISALDFINSSKIIIHFFIKVPNNTFKSERCNYMVNTYYYKYCIRIVNVSKKLAIG